jgi:TRAP-type transport system small permease protein
VLDRILEWIEQWVILPLLAVLLAFITIGVFIVVVMRYGFSTSFLWGEELSIFAFIWTVFLGAVIGVRRHIHLEFDFLGERLTGRWRGGQKLVIDLSILGTGLLLLVEGWTFADMSLRRFSPALGISLYLPTLVIPISGALMMLAVVGDLRRDLRLIVTGRSA